MASQHNSSQNNPLRSTKSYRIVKKRPGPKRKSIAERRLVPPPAIKNPHRSYTTQFKLRVLSYWHHTEIRTGPSTTRSPNRAEVSDRYKIPVTNLSRWKKEEARLIQHVGTSRRQRAGKRIWIVMETIIYERFIDAREEGKVIRRGWFRRQCRELWTTCYSDKVESFSFSNGWFHSFLAWHNISLRFGTNKASQLPVNYQDTIINWLRFNRRNSQIRSDNEHGLGDSTEIIGRYRLSNICNMDQTPLPFEYLDGQTYNTVGEKTIWIKASKQSGWDKRQGTIQLTVFADGIPRVKPLLFFRGQGVGATVVTEMKEYDPRVVVKFNPTAYANSVNMIQWLDEQVVPILDNQPTLMVLDLFGGHKTDDVLDTFLAHDITVSTIPGGCTGLVQPLDVSINRPFKDIFRVSNSTQTSME